MDVLGHDADEIERLRGLIADLCDPKPGCWQRALKAGRAEVARPAATPRGAVDLFEADRTNLRNLIEFMRDTAHDDERSQAAHEALAILATLRGGV